jgi:hypothetical protein
MKIKLDYVTNSSSVSVVLLGTTLDEDIIHNKNLKEKLLEIYNTKFTEEEKKIYKNMNEEELLEELLSEPDLVFQKIGLDYASRDYHTWVGISPFKIKDNETGLEFKERVSNLLKEIGLDVSIDKLEKIKESWYDG